MLTDVALIWKQSKVCMFVSKVYTAIRIKSGRTSPALPYFLYVRIFFSTKENSSSYRKTPYITGYSGPN